MDRGNGIIQLTSAMTSSLLDYNYDYLNLGRRNSMRAGFLILAIYIYRHSSDELFSR